MCIRDRGDTRRTGTERPAYRGTEDAAQRISDLEREIKQRDVYKRQICSSSCDKVLRTAFDFLTALSGHYGKSLPVYLQNQQRCV